uniref:AAA domain-containing protein n=1 Tax=Echinostoma caproni TaxID=27848 RepID=A0A183BAX5_9TREM
LARCNSNLFHGKDSFITLRDLFRWAERYRLATCDHDVGESVLFDWDGYLADQGYLLLAGRVRNPTEARVVAEAIEAVFRRPISESRLFDFTSESSPASLEFLTPVLGSQPDGEPRRLPTGFEHIVWTRDMRRLLVLVGNALKYQEPVLLVGETGCGKTTVCQLFASLKAQRLHCVNCHQYTEAADFLGALRPVRHSSDNPNKACEDNRLFEWVDGPLVTAMSNGEMFLLDEISLADDAVLERLNSLLEPERRIHLTERSELADNANTLTGNDLVAHPQFRFVATMNPGGDYGKKELSPALRNRFTEIWCLAPTLIEPVQDGAAKSNALIDLTAIVRHNLEICVPSGTAHSSASMFDQLASTMVEFVHWYAQKQAQSQSSALALMNRRCVNTRSLVVQSILFHCIEL